MNIVRSNHRNPEFNSLMKNFLSDDFLNWPNAKWEMNRNGMPPVNIAENEDGYNIQLAVPGMNKEDFKIELDGDSLVISAEIKGVREEKAENFTRKEFGFRSFKRSFILPENSVNAEAIKASYENGVLGVQLPKKEEAKPQPAKMIEIS
jgi:HSP20 family protein